MASAWTKRLTTAGMLLGGIYVVVAFINPARGTIDSNERPKTVVEAVTASRADTPLELSPMEIIRIQPTTLVCPSCGEAFRAGQGSNSVI